MIFYLEVAFELLLQFFLKSGLRVQARHFVFVLVGHELEHRAGRGCREQFGAGCSVAFRSADAGHELAIALGIGGVLIGGEKIARGAQ